MTTKNRMTLTSDDDMSRSLDEITDNIDRVIARGAPPTSYYLRQFVKKCGSQRDVARRLVVSESLVSRLIRGEMALSIEVATVLDRELHANGAVVRAAEAELDARRRRREPISTVIAAALEIMPAKHQQAVIRTLASQLQSMADDLESPPAPDVPHQPARGSRPARVGWTDGSPSRRSR